MKRIEIPEEIKNFARPVKSRPNQWNIITRVKSFLDFHDIISYNKLDIKRYKPPIKMSGENHPNCKLKGKDLKDIFEMKEKGISSKEIANVKNVHENTINKILRGASRKNAYKQYKR